MLDVVRFPWKMPRAFMSAAIFLSLSVFFATVYIPFVSVCSL